MNSSPRTQARDRTEMPTEEKEKEDIHRHGSNYSGAAMWGLFLTMASETHHHRTFSRRMQSLHVAVLTVPSATHHQV